MTSKRFFQAILDAVPLSISVTPWGILFGSLAIQADLSVWQSQLLSLAVFAGAAQMSGVAVIGTGGGLFELINNTTMIGARHLLYSASLKDDIRELPFIKRVAFAFLLTDELFAIAHADKEKNGRFDYSYSLLSGFAFYVVWNIATFVGIMATTSVEGINDLGLDFAIAATFIAMTVPRLKGSAMITAVIVSGSLAIALELQQVHNGLIIAGLVGMVIGYIMTERGISWKK